MNNTDCTYGIIVSLFMLSDSSLMVDDLKKDILTDVKESVSPRNLHDGEEQIV